MGLILAIAAPDGKGCAAGGGRGALLNQHGFGGDRHPDGAWWGGCAQNGAVGRHGDGVATVVGVGVAEGVEDFDGAIYACKAAVEHVAHPLWTGLGGAA